MVGLVLLTLPKTGRKSVKSRHPLLASRSATANGRGPEGRFKQVLYNYLSNALKFTDSGSVTITVRPEGDDLFRLEVADSGVGISESDLSQLFTDFHQLDSGKNKRYQGAGLGLALTRRIVEAQGGRVGVRSVLGQGSTFFAVLPRIPAGDLQHAA